MTWGPDSGLSRQVRALEEAYVATATNRAITSTETVATPGVARACAGAVASRYLAVGTPRSIGIVIGDSVELAIASLVAHHTWFRWPQARWFGPNADHAKVVTGEVVSLAEALAADIVCILAPIKLSASQLRRGTHVNALAEVTLDDELRALATIADEAHDLPRLAAGFVDGRQLDELTVFVAGDAAIARRALGHRP